LPSYFESVSTFVDAVVALDDGSSDDTGAALERQPLVKVLLENPRRDGYRGWDDAGNRQRLLDAAAALDPRWILFLDADERIDAADGLVLRRFAERELEPRTAYLLPVYRMIDDEDHCDPAARWMCRLFTYEAGQKLPSDRLHLVPVPTSISLDRRYETTIRIKHLGNLTEAERKARYEKYSEADPARRWQRTYAHLLRAPVRVQKWRERPSSLPVLRNGPAFAEDDAELSRPELTTVLLAVGDHERDAEAVRAATREVRGFTHEVVVVTRGPAEPFPSPGNPMFFPCDARASRPALLNAGLAASNGRYIVFRDASDAFDVAAECARVARHRGGYAVVTAPRLSRARHPGAVAAYLLDRYALNERLQGPALVDTAKTWSFLREALVAIGGFPDDPESGPEAAAAANLHTLGYGRQDLDVAASVDGRPAPGTTSLVKERFALGRWRGRSLIDEAASERGRLSGGRLARQLLRHPLFCLVTIWRERGEWDESGNASPVFSWVILGAISEWMGLCWQVARQGKEAGRLVQAQGRWDKSWR
jgi:hypothetical protein